MTKKKHFGYRSFWPEWETMSRFRDAGVNTITFFPSNTVNSLGEPYCKYPPNWLWYDTYDFAPVEQQINDILQANPDAELICMLDLNTPLWLARNMTDEHIDSYGKLSCALCSSVWREAVAKYLRTIVAFLEKNYALKIISYVLACGVTDEWMDYSDGMSNRAKAETYGYIIPSRQELAQGGFNERWSDPKEDKETIRYWRFTSNIIADSIVSFGRLVKSMIRQDVEIGVFYGYILELQERRLVRCGHLAYEKVLASDVIDYLISPASYADRKIGQGCGFMIPEVTIRRHGKDYMHECDYRTHTYNRNLTPYVKIAYEPWPDEVSDIAGMRRAMAMSLINNTSLWWFDMWGGFYQGKECLENIKLMKKIWDEYTGAEYPMNAEIALVVDPDSLFYFNDACSENEASLFIPIRRALSHCGAPFEIMSFSDISESADFDRYKFVIFASLFEVTDEKMKVLRERVLRDNRTILWVDVAGICDGKRNSLTAMHNLCGFAYRESFSVKKTDYGTSAYIHKPMDVSASVLRELASQAGVNIVTVEEQPVYSNERFLAIHTAHGGIQKISLGKTVRKVTELFSGKVVGENCSELEYSFNSPDTVLFELNGQ